MVIDYKTLLTPECEGVNPPPPPPDTPYDVVLDATGKTLSWSEIAPKMAAKGVWLHMTAPLSLRMLAVWQQATFRPKRVKPFVPWPSSKDLAVLAELVAENKLRIVKDATVPFETGVDAWTKSKEGHTVGKIVITHTT